MARLGTEQPRFEDRGEIVTHPKMLRASRPARLRPRPIPRTFIPR
jgi:hypothetical protein